MVVGQRQTFKIPERVVFTELLERTLDENTLGRLTQSIFKAFDDEIGSLIEQGKYAEIPPIASLHFYNIFGGIGESSIYIETAWTNCSDTVHVLDFSMFKADEIPDFVLDRLNDLRTAGEDVEKRTELIHKKWKP